MKLQFFKKMSLCLLNPTFFINLCSYKILFPLHKVLLLIRTFEGTRLYTRIQFPQSQKKGLRYPGTGITNGHEVGGMVDENKT